VVGLTILYTEGSEELGQEITSISVKRQVLIDITKNGNFKIY